MLSTLVGSETGLTELNLKKNIYLLEYLYGSIYGSEQSGFIILPKILFNSDFSLWICQKG
jgi:hypothetical protein